MSRLIAFCVLLFTTFPACQRDDAAVRRWSLVGQWESTGFLDQQLAIRSDGTYDLALTGLGLHRTETGTWSLAADRLTTTGPSPDGNPWIYDVKWLDRDTVVLNNVREKPPGFVFHRKK